MLSDNLAATAKEIHAAELGQRYVGDILRNFHASDRRPDGMVMMNRIGRETGGTPSAMYARALVRTVASGLRIFRRGVGLPSIGNVHVLIDFNEQHNGSGEFWNVIRDERRRGNFSGVSHVAMIDSAAYRLLQLADLAAASRNWGIDAGKLENRFGILSSDP